MSGNETERKLNEAFAQGQRLIFWYDEAGEYAGEIDSLQLDASVLKLTGKDYFRAKVLLEHEAKDRCFLVYAPFARPRDEENPLADTVHYSRVFSTDRISEVMLAMGIPANLRPAPAAYPLFWRSNARIDKFTTLDIQPMTEENIHIAILCALSGSRVVHFDEVVKRLLEGGVERGQSMLESFGQMGALDTFWTFCEKFYGLSLTAPSLDRLIATLLCTYSAAQHAELPERLRNYVTSKKNNVSVFLSNFMANANTSDVFDQISADYTGRLQVREALEAMPTETLLSLDAFAAVDEILLGKAVDVLLEEDPDRTIGGLDLPALKERRADSGLHFSEKFRDYYRMLLHARELMLLAREPLYFSTAREMAETYRKDLYRGDMAYRKFCLLYEQAEHKQTYEKLSGLVERLYVNEWQDLLTRQFSDLLEQSSRDALGIPLQEKFASLQVKPRVGKERTVVLISDAFRYECGRELADILNRDVKFDAQLETMVTALPSITDLGMAALLPHRDIRVSEDFSVSVDGSPCATMVQREEILKRHYPNALCLKLDAVLSMGKRELQERCTGKDVVYVYHDQIDSTGSAGSSENEVFSACEDALRELERGIRKLTDSISSTYFLVTADHGFLYRRSVIGEHEKIDVRGLGAIAAAKRYRLTAQPEQLPGTLSFVYQYTTPPTCVSFPRNASVFKQQGGGANFVHGGTSLAEMIVPLLTVKTKRGRQNVRKAAFTLLNTQKRITNLITYLEFIQDEPVSDTVRPTQYKAWFETESGQVISGVEQLPATSGDTSAQGRLVKQRFTLQNRKYRASERYYLVLQDAGDAIAQPQKQEFTIDIAFADDFGFRV